MRKRDWFGGNRALGGGGGRCRVEIWFKPVDDESAHAISKKFQLCKG